LKLRVGISPCPNDVFIFSGILLGEVKPSFEADFIFEDVQTLNRLTQDGKGDLMKISYANAPNCLDYSLLHCGGALGRGCGPLLLTGGNPWDPQSEILVPGEQTTAHFLLNFWANGPLKKRFLPFDVCPHHCGIHGLGVLPAKFQGFSLVSP